MADEQTSTTVDTTTTTTEPWYKGVDEGTLGEIKRRGLEASDPVSAFTNVLKSHLEAEKLVGAPTNEVVRWPKDATDAAGWTALRTRLGVPSDPNEYDFSTLKTADGKDPDPAFVSALREAAKTAYLPKDAATEVAKAVLAYNQKTAADTAAQTAAKAEADLQALKTAWGSNYDANRAAVQSMLGAMMEKAGVKAEDLAGTLNAMEGQVGGYKTMETLLAMTRMAGEDRTALGGGGPSGGNIVSFEEAKATRASLLRDNAFVAKWNSGDAEAIKQIAALDRIIVNTTPQTDEDIFRAQLAEQRRG